MRRLSPVRFAALLVCGFALMPSIAFAQGKARVRSDDLPLSGGQPQSPLPAAQEQRPAAEPLRVAAADPRLEAVLTAWHEKTREIKKLQGVHRRWTFEPTFQVAMASSGKFYFEAPDRGRIDLEPDDPAKIADIDPAQEGTQIRQDGTKTIYTVKADQPEKWICDGAQVLKIDDAARTFEAIPIPPEHRGTNIMDGPLPFLFGLPPEKAKQRYQMKLGSSPVEGTIYIIATPLLRFDAANWQRADILLDANTYLPTMVKLLDPAGKKSTLYSFGEHQINKVNLLAWIGAGDPFRPTMFGYKQVQSEQPAPVRVVEGKEQKVTGVPSVLGLDWKKAEAILNARGYGNVIKVKDKAPSDPKLRWHVKSQSPPPSADAPQDKQVVLTIYVTEEDLAKAAENRTGK